MRQPPIKRAAIYVKATAGNSRLHLYLQDGSAPPLDLLHMHIPHWPWFRY